MIFVGKVRRARYKEIVPNVTIEIVCPLGVKILLLLPPPLDEAFHAGELLAIDIKRIISDAP